MWQEHGEDSRAAYWYADRIARSHGLKWVTSDLLMSGLLEDENCTAYKLLAACNLLQNPKLATLESVKGMRRFVRATLLRGHYPVKLTQDAHAAIYRAREIAKELASPSVNSEHILLALFEQSPWSGIISSTVLREQLQILAEPKSIFKHGFSTIEGVFSPSETAEMIEALPQLDGAAGTRGLLNLPWCRNLSQNPKFLGLVHDAIGPSAVAVRGILFDKNPTSNWNLGWHQDTKIAVRQRVETEGFTAWSEKEGVVHCQPPLSVLEASVAVRIHLDPCGADNGPLQVLPGSHLLGLSKDAPKDLLSSADSCLANVGDVILMKPLTWHASSKATSPNHRRVIHLEYCAVELPNGLEWAYSPGEVAPQ